MIKGLLSSLVALLISCFSCQAPIAFSLFGERIDLPTSALLNISGNLTLMGWVKTTDVQPHYFIVGYQISPATFVGYALGISNKITLYTSSGSGVSTYSSTTIIDGRWHHVAATLTGTAVAFYLDGVPDGTGTGSVPSGFSGTRYLGGDTGTVTVGSISGCAIFNKALPASAIEVIAKSRKTTAPLAWGPVGYWPLINVPDGASGSAKIFLDISGNNLHGVGNVGTNATGMICSAETILSYP